MVKYTTYCQRFRHSLFLHIRADIHIDMTKMWQNIYQIYRDGQHNLDNKNI